jgi:hypothetical protein
LHGVVAGSNVSAVIVTVVVGPVVVGIGRWTAVGTRRVCTGGINVRVPPDVFCQMVGSGESMITNTARELLFACVNACVPRQLIWKSKKNFYVKWVSLSNN